MREYKYLIVPFITLVIAQLIKFIIESSFEKKLRWGRLFNGSGGMPSAHSSFSSAVTMMVGLNNGFNNPIFAVSLVFSFIVAYDSLGLRKESGLHAEALNKIGDEIFSKEGYRIGFNHLKEELGHNPSEVLMGVILGIVSSLVFTFIIFK